MGKIDCNRLLYLHVGGGKTGSSAIQNMLNKNISALSNGGVDYIVDYELLRGDQITSGNGSALLNALKRGVDGKKLDRLIEGYFGQHDTSIISSEGLRKIPEAGYLKLIESANRIGVRLHVIFYLRDIVSFYISYYDQCIKRDSLSLGMLEWLRGCDDYDQILFLKVVSGYLHQVKLSVVHYNTNKKNLLKSFLDVVQLSVDEGLVYDESIIVNRSLSAVERDLLILVNSVSNSKDLSTRLSDYMLYNMECKEVDRKVDIEVVKYLSDRYASDVDWINNVFFDGKKTFSVAGSDYEVVDNCEMIGQFDCCNQIEVYEEVVKWFSSEGNKKTKRDSLLGCTKKFIVCLMRMIRNI